MLTRSEPSFDAAYRGFDLPSGSTMLAAVSGGSDSVALLVSLSACLTRHRPDINLIAVTVDHGLRAQSAAEAEAVARLCASLGVRHITRRWTGDKPDAGIAAAARSARYRLLCEAAEETGAAAIVTGHTANDQAETIAMRLQRGSGRGLSGMAPATLLEGRFWLLRPLLAARRETLRKFLLERGIEWIDDPTNENLAYERPRIRHALAGKPGIDDLAALGSVAASRRELLGVNAAALIEALVSRPAPGLIEIKQDLLQQQNHHTAVYAMRILLAVAGGVSHLPDEAKTRAMLETLGHGGEHIRLSLSRCVIDRRKAAIFVYRENRNLPYGIRVAARVDWDGRYRIQGAPSPDGSLIGPTGRGGADAKPVADVPLSILRAAQSAEPAVTFPGMRPQLLSAEPLGVRASPIAAPWAVLLPSYDLAPARAIAALIGAAIPPNPPYRGHSEGQA